MFEKQTGKSKIILIGHTASLLSSAVDSTVVSTAMKSIAGSLGRRWIFS